MAVLNLSILEKASDNLCQIFWKCGTIYIKEEGGHILYVIEMQKDSFYCRVSLCVLLVLTSSALHSLCQEYLVNSELVFSFYCNLIGGI